jgi:hypothetical protein
LDKRRFEAVEKIWAAINDHTGKLKYISGTVAILKYNAVAKRANDPKMQQLLSVYGASLPEPNDMPSNALDEQLFVPPLVWAYFNAYTTILRTNVTIFKLAQADITDLDEIISVENIRTALKAALPHQATFIDENEPSRFHYLLDELESRLLSELQKVLEGKDVDELAASRAKEVLDAISRAAAQEARASTEKILGS